MKYGEFFRRVEFAIGANFSKPPHGDADEIIAAVGVSNEGDLFADVVVISTETFYLFQTESDKMIGSGNYTADEFISLLEAKNLL